MFTVFTLLCSMVSGQNSAARYLEYITPIKSEINSGKDIFYHPEKAEYYSEKVKLPFKPNKLLALKPIGIHADGSVDYLYYRNPFKKKKRTGFLFRLDENLQVKNVVRKPLVRGKHLLSPIFWEGEGTDYLFIDPVGKKGETAKVGLGDFTQKGRFEKIRWANEIEMPKKSRKLLYSDVISAENKEGQMVVTHFMAEHSHIYYKQKMELLLSFLPEKGKLDFSKRVRIPRLIKNFNIVDYHLEKDGGLYLLIEFQDYDDPLSFHQDKKKIKKTKGRKAKRQAKKESKVTTILATDGFVRKGLLEKMPAPPWRYSVSYIHPDSTNVNINFVGLRKNAASIRLIVDSTELILAGTYGDWNKIGQKSRFYYSAPKTNITNWNKVDTDMSNMFRIRNAKGFFEGENKMPFVYDQVRKDENGVLIAGQMGVNTLPQYFGQLGVSVLQKDKELHHQKPQAFSCLPQDFNDWMYASGKRRISPGSRVILSTGYYSYADKKGFAKRNTKTSDRAYSKQFRILTDFASQVENEDVERLVWDKSQSGLTPKEHLGVIPSWIPMRSKTELMYTGSGPFSIVNWFNRNRSGAFSNPLSLKTSSSKTSSSDGETTETTTYYSFRNQDPLMATGKFEKVMIGRFDNDGVLDTNSMIVFNHDGGINKRFENPIGIPPVLIVGLAVAVLPIGIAVASIIDTYKWAFHRGKQSLRHQYSGTKLEILDDGRVVAVYNETGKKGPNRKIKRSGLLLPKKCHTQIRVYSPEGKLERYMFVETGRNEKWLPKMKNVFITEHGVYTWVFSSDYGMPKEFTKIFIPFGDMNTDIVGIPPTENELERFLAGIDVEEEELDEDAEHDEFEAGDELDDKQELKKAKREAKALKRAKR